jgi:sortase A
MRGFFLSLCSWLLIASGSYLAVTGLLDYRESLQAQRQMARQWNSFERARAPEAPPQTPPETKTPESVVPETQGDPPEVTQPASSPGGTPVAKLLIPRLGTVLYVVEGIDDRDLRRGPGHLIGTVLPGEDGNCIIAGHRDTHFRVLKDMQKGDEVILERRGHRFRYRVDEMSVVPPENTASLVPTRKPVLNLITCYPFEYMGVSPRRYIVHAGLENSALQAAR